MIVVTMMRMLMRSMLVLLYVQAAADMDVSAILALRRKRTATV
jgi:hypothetical protein